LIARGADVMAHTAERWTPLHLASVNGHLNMTKLLFLLECGVDVDIWNGSDETSLYLASGSGKLDIVCFLVEDGADVNIQHDNLWSPLHIAAANGHLEIAELLVEHE
ncbi:ankyrin, partial [Imleria badia]